MLDATTDINALKNKHEALYKQLLLDWQARPEEFKEEEEELNPHLDKFRDLVRQLRTAATEAEYVEDYTWFAKALVIWQQTFSSVLEVPLHLEEGDVDSAAERPEDLDSVLQKSEKTLIPDPPPLRNRPVNLEGEVKHYSQIASFFRRLERESTREEEQSDWHHGEVLLSSDVLDGKIDFVQKVEEEAFKHLEAAWLKEVIEIKAYFRYIDRQAKGSEPNDHKANYFHACEYYRWRLISSRAKYGSEYFSTVRGYVKTHFLDANQRLDHCKSRELIRRKAERYHKSNVFGNEAKDWESAEEFVRTFYENIIAAVGRWDKMASGDRAVRDEVAKSQVVKAILMSEGPDSPLSIMNAFEAAIAIYFLKDLKGLPPDWYEQATAFEEKLKKENAAASKAS